MTAPMMTIPDLGLDLGLGGLPGEGGPREAAGAVPLQPAAAPRPLPPEAVLAHGLGLAQGLRALEEAQGSAGLLGALLTKVVAAVQLGEPVGAQEALGQAQGLLRTLDEQLRKAMVAVAMKVETQRQNA